MSTEAIQSAFSFDTAESSRLARCKHAPEDKPFARICWYKTPDDVCEWCERVERSSRELAVQVEVARNAETYYEHIRRAGGCGTLADWAADLYEEAGKDLEKAVASIEASGAYPEDVALIEKHLRLLPERNLDVVAKWFAAP